MSGEPPEAMLRWRCRRGMRELDLLLLHYLERTYPGASPAERAAFVALLSRQDPDILGLLSGRLAADDVATAHVVRHLLTRP